MGPDFIGAHPLSQDSGINYHVDQRRGATVHRGQGPLKGRLELSGVFHSFAMAAEGNHQVGADR